LKNTAQRNRSQRPKRAGTQEDIVRKNIEKAGGQKPAFLGASQIAVKGPEAANEKTPRGNVDSEKSHHTGI